MEMKSGAESLRATRLQLKRVEWLHQIFIFITCKSFYVTRKLKLFRRRKHVSLFPFTRQVASSYLQLVNPEKWKQKQTEMGHVAWANTVVQFVMIDVSIDISLIFLIVSHVSSWVNEIESFSPPQRIFLSLKRCHGILFLIKRFPTFASVPPLSKQYDD